MGFVGKYIQPAFNSVWNAGQKASAVGPLIAMQHVGRAVWSERNFEAFAKEGYQKNVVAFVAIDRVSKAVGLPKWTLSNKRGVKIEQHPLLDLLNRPNPLLTGRSYISGTVAFRLISGNAYTEKVGPNRTDAPPKELYSLRPDRMTVVAGKQGFPQAYEYRVGSDKKIFKVDFIRGRADIQHWKTFNPLNDYYGMSPLEAAAMSIDTHNAGSELNKSLLDNSARPSGAMKVKDGGTLTEPEYIRLKKEITEKYSGPRNAGRPMLLEGDLEWVQMGLSPRELEFLEGKNTTARDIAMVYGYPPQLLGIPGDNTYSNLQEARLGLWEDTVIPLREELTNELQNWLVPSFGDDLVLGFDLDDIPALALRRQKTYERVENASFLMVNEKRKQVGLEPVEGGDVIMQPASFIPLGTEDDEDEGEEPKPNVNDDDEE